ncbi:OLC1v1017709C1 [Oldenlandia corymbosa var. corymbosa]|uniref:OLC1v1017709C1 n=1 Tax=Oldenlandia corymbosa var. corymbosa TaxID=529605 RepID=A0AAV1EA35_OLDCO|nr:OLC1v1017709C1 [Oldenlandia corymbosa var. corymbosa]
MDSDITYPYVDQLLLTDNMHDHSQPPLKKHKKLSSSSAAHNNVIIPDDIISNILKRLPVKSLLRFKCVSRDWWHMIKTPWFIDMHRLHSHHRPDGVKVLATTVQNTTRRQKIIRRDQYFLLVDPEGNSMPVPHPMVGSVWVRPPNDRDSQAGVEGLICFKDMVWNPTTRKTFHLPAQYFNVPLNRGGGLNRYKFENSDYLGFDSSTKQYKVLSICAGCRAKSRLRKKYTSHSKRIEFLRGMFQMQVITLEGAKSSWRDITHHIPGEAIKDMTLMWSPISPNLYLKDEIYILVGYPEYLALMVFSVGQETFRFIHLPKEIKHAEARWWVMIEVSECVGLMMVDADTAGIEIWRLINTVNTSSIHHNKAAAVAREEWQKITYTAWPTNLYHPKISNPESLREPFVRCAIGNTENLVQTVNEGNTEYYFSYWDIRQRVVKEAPTKLQEILQRYYIFSKHVETLFDPEFP